MKKYIWYIIVSIVGAVLTIGSVFIYNPLSVLLYSDSDGYGIPYPYKTVTVETSTYASGGTCNMTAEYYAIAPFLFDWVVLSLVTFVSIRYWMKRRRDKALAEQSGLVCDNCGLAVLADDHKCPSCGESFDETDEIAESPAGNSTRSTLKSRGWLRRAVEVQTADGPVLVTYDGHGFGTEKVTVNDVALVRRSESSWFVPRFDVVHNNDNYVVQVRVWPWLTLRSITVRRNGALIYSEGKPPYATTRKTETLQVATFFLMFGGLIALWYGFA